jgi:formate dehydrogenase subunit beta
MKGAILNSQNGMEKSILNFLKRGLDSGSFNAILIPLRVPAGDSFAWVLVKDKSLLENASPLPPVMPVQGAKALYSLTRCGGLKEQIAVVMRPCEVSAAIELFKLEQIDLENIVLISVDCPGVIPLGDYIANPDKGDADFKQALKQWESDSVRPLCKICSNFSMPSSDLHIGLLGAPENNIYLIPASLKGKEILEKLDISPTQDMDSWEEKVSERMKLILRNKEQQRKEIKSKVFKADKLLDTLSKCINCHNCMRVCPLCYCRQCYFDSDALKLSPENYLMRAERKAGLRFPPDTLLFHLGRMSHMSFSCVSCGTCEDACPMDIPISQIFSLVGENAQKVFDYMPGRSKDEPIPLVAYQEEELQDVIKPYVETYVKQEK